MTRLMKFLGFFFFLGVVACGNPTQRFVPIGDNQVYALDTKTGQQCVMLSKEGLKPDEVPPGPFCYDLYKNGN